MTTHMAQATPEQLLHDIQVVTDLMAYQVKTQPLRDLVAAQQEIDTVKAGIEKTGKTFNVNGCGIEIKAVRTSTGDFLTFGLLAPVGSVLESADGMSSFIITHTTKDVSGNVMKVLPCFSKVHFEVKGAPRRIHSPYSGTPASIEISRRGTKCTIPAGSRPSNDSIVCYAGKRFTIDGLFPSEPGTCCLSLTPEGSKQ